MHDTHTLQNYCQIHEPSSPPHQAFEDIAGGAANAMAEYNEFQVRQLTKLIEVTRTDLKKPDRQKIMNMITIDAHSRDIVAQIVDAGADKVDCFQWVC